MPEENNKTTQDQGGQNKTPQQTPISQKPSFGLAASILGQNSSAVSFGISPNKIKEGNNR